jgi:hypothetical protein
MPKEAKKEFSLSPLSGGINSVAEDGLLVSVFSPQNPQPIELRDMENWVPTRRGGLSKTAGFTMVRPIGSNPITGLYEFKRSNGAITFLCSSGISLHTFTDAVHTSISTDITSGAYVHFETALDKCIICDGVKKPKLYDGTTVSTLAGADTGVRASLFYQNRLFYFRTDADTSLLYYSNVSDITTGYATQFIPCGLNDGEKITAIAKYFVPNSLEAIIFVAKERSVGIVTGLGSTDSPYTFTKINQDAGVPTFNGVTQYGERLVYLTKKGVAQYSIGQQTASPIYEYLSTKVRNKFIAFDMSLLANAIVFYDWLQTRIGFAVTEKSTDVYNNVIWYFDIELQCWYKERWNSGQNCTAIMVTSDGIQYHGSSTGRIFKHSGANNFDGGAIFAYFETDYIDFGTLTNLKRLNGLQTVCSGSGQYQMSVGHILNYGLQQSKTLTVALDKPTSQWGNTVWSASAATAQWGGKSISYNRVYPSGWFRNCKFVFSQSSANEAVDIYGITGIVEHGVTRL